MSEQVDTVVADAKRIVNLGEKITLAKLGEVVVREPSLEALLGVFGDVAALVMGLRQDQDAKTQFAAILMSPKARESLRACAAVCISKQAADLVDMGLTDWLRLFAAIQKVVNFKEIKELFTQTGLPAWLQSRQTVSKPT